ncbi:hypothetical protein AVV44_gp027 [Cronobacter phage S13]|jgi:hypothetical protein|uniref:Uncharacterized protein n=1 Tax=Cronobacter phage LPCS28 TaxID=2924885 RepID=A0AAE9G5E7_9CAUD|nr:hypothetical protein AVV44_gp027 [Cronobacter phage S13]YP_010665878.1 hypothetical protein PQB73_gp146 [Cronobacter phage LPCS28]AIA64826.1 hypothetical protein S13_027 [Cronobacter phage S13]UNY47067.1 hypothetical protein EHEKIMEA_00185 [Cronobacter phage LPCS28]
MKITIADIKAIARRKMYQYAHCNLSKNNPYYINDGMIKHAEAWFKEFAEIKELSTKQVVSMEAFFNTQKQIYLFA